MPKMASIPVKVKHNGKVYDIELNTSQPATAFKQSIYEKTGVPLDRQKVMIKGGMLKDDTDVTKIGARPGQTFMVIGTAGELPKAPTAVVTFLEDMTDEQVAQATKTKAGLTNLGNTCYLNSTLQVLRAIPELQTALNNFSGTMGGADGEANLTASLRDLYKAMAGTTDAFPPLAFLSILRQVAPQFAEMSRQGGGYAQQDAEEAWVRIVNALSASLKGLPAAGDAGANALASSKFVEQYMTGQMMIKRSTAEAPQEEPSYSSDPFTILQCNISSSTNEMTSGILDSLNEQIEKRSETLGRTAVYDETRRIDRLPAYLTVHFVRFYWRREINKKTKIMRKVKFPFELDVTPFVSDNLKPKIRNANDTVRSVEKERQERAKIRRKVRAREEAAARAADPSKPAPPAASSSDAMAVDGAAEAEAAAAGVEQASSSGPAPGAALSEEEELALREKESKQIREAIDAELAKDIGANPHGLYELVGVVTHKGPAADAGHYISWTRKEHETHDAKGKATLDQPTEHEWYKFDDDKVSVVKQDRIQQLDGGGEDSVAYILLYRAKQIE